MGLIAFQRPPPLTEPFLGAYRLITEGDGTMKQAYIARRPRLLSIAPKNEPAKGKPRLRRGGFLNPRALESRSKLSTPLFICAFFIDCVISHCF